MSFSLEGPGISGRPFLPEVQNEMLWPQGRVGMGRSSARTHKLFPLASRPGMKRAWRQRSPENSLPSGLVTHAISISFGWEVRNGLRLGSGGKKSIGGWCSRQLKAPLYLTAGSLEQLLNPFCHLGKRNSPLHMLWFRVWDAKHLVRLTNLQPFAASAAWGCQGPIHTHLPAKQVLGPDPSRCQSRCPGLHLPGSLPSPYFEIRPRADF